jgi:hypothetical protein
MGICGYGICVARDQEMFQDVAALAIPPFASLWHPSMQSMEGKQRLEQRHAEN